MHKTTPLHIIYQTLALNLLKTTMPISAFKSFNGHWFYRKINVKVSVKDLALKSIFNLSLFEFELRF